MAKRSRRPVTPRPAPVNPPAASPAPATDPDATLSAPASSATSSVSGGQPARPQTSRAKRTSTSTRPRRATAPQKSFFERYRGLIIGGAAVIGVLIVGYFLFFANKGPQGNFVASGPKYVCDTLLTPGPSETLPAPAPSLASVPATTAASNSPAASSASPAAAGSPSASGAPSASGSTSASQAPASGGPSAGPSAAPSAAPSASPAGSPTPEPTATPQPTLRLGFTTRILGWDHILNAGQTIEYGFCPPTSGNHYNVTGAGPIRAAVYPSTAEQPPGSWIHNLEHGWVVMLYRCPGGQPGQNGCPTTDQIAQMQQLYDQAPKPDSSQGNCDKEMIVARFDSMTTQFAELAWGRALMTDDFDLDRALTFAQQWTDPGTERETSIC